MLLIFFKLSTYSLKVISNYFKKYFSKCEFLGFAKMGGWGLEAFKMAIYMTFPVALFHYFNQPEYFENWVINFKQENYIDKNNVILMKQTIKEMREKSDQEYLEKLSKSS